MARPFRALWQHRTVWLYHLQWVPLYWRVKRVARDVRFRIGRGAFEAREKMSAGLTSAAILRQILSTIAGQALVGVFLVFGLWYLENGIEKSGFGSWLPSL